jgi:hypothetical protein
LRQNQFSPKAGAALGIFFVTLHCYHTDRLFTFEKASEQYCQCEFMEICLLSAVIGLASVRKNTERVPLPKSDAEDTRDSGFLSRDQTEEWKGWMQCIVPLVSLYRCIQDSLDIQARKNSGCIISFHDGMRTYRLLSSLWKLPIKTCGQGCSTHQPIHLCPSIRDAYRLPVLLAICRAATILSIVALPVFFFCIQPFRTNNSYNVFHPHISRIPILSFVILRNSHVTSATQTLTTSIVDGLSLLVNQTVNVRARAD